MEIHVVQAGESVYSIARQYGVEPQRIFFDNEITAAQKLVVGQTLVIQFPAVTYTVQPGDTLDSIAAYTATTVRQLLRNNPVVTQNETIYPGQTLAITLKKTSQIGPLAVSGYVYPDIDRHQLIKQLPYLTYMSVFSYGFRSDGTLINVADNGLVQLARQYRVASLMVFSSLSDDGTFSTSHAAQLFSDQALQDKVIGEIAKTVIAKGYYGVDVDFEYVSQQYSEGFVAFLTKLEQRMAQIHTKVFVTLAPKTSDDQTGVLYEGHDYSRLAAIADKSLLMTYEWGYTYGPPMAVAPINKVRQVVEYAIGEIPPEKILMGIPNYGYDWRLPYVRDQSKADTLGNVEAVNLARRMGAVIEYDTVSQSPYFQYYDHAGSEHVVWFEDARSISAKLTLAGRTRLFGIGIWQLMKFFPQMMLLINGMTQEITVV